MQTETWQSHSRDPFLWQYCNGREDIFLCYYSPILCSDNNVKRLNKSSRVMPHLNKQQLRKERTEKTTTENKIKTV